jgi:hypothetical protein
MGEKQSVAEIEESDSIIASANYTVEAEEGESDIARVKSIQNNFSNAIAELKDRIAELEAASSIDPDSLPIRAFGWGLRVCMAVLFGATVVGWILGGHILHWHDGDEIWYLYWMPF